MNVGRARAATKAPAAVVPLAALALLLSLALQLGGANAGAFKMFTDPVRYRVRLHAVSADGKRTPFRLSRLEPHLGRDARRVVVRAEEWFVGETQVTLLGDGLEDLGELACRVEPRVQKFELALERRSIEFTSPDVRLARVTCDEH